MKSAFLTLLLALACYCLSPIAMGQHRIAWTSSQLAGSPDPPKPMIVVEAFPKLRFNHPVLIRWQPELGRYFVGEVSGRIVSFAPDESTEQSDLAIDLKKVVKDFDAEKSFGMHELYGMEFDPQFSENRFVYLCYVLGSKTADGVPNGTRLSRFRVNDDQPPTLDPTSEHVVLEWLGGGHNGGDLAFGPDGMLYVSTGDGTGPSPPDIKRTGQDVSDLLSSILRIDVRQSTAENPYQIPADNPFVQLSGARPEIWAYGFRNPWRMSIDAKTGQLWVGDVGWELWELVHRVDRGGNYGWSIREGNETIVSEQPSGPTPLLPPQYAFPHSEAASITGGYVYRGRKFPEWYGSYVCGDWATGRIWGLPIEQGSIIGKHELVQSLHRFVSFGLDRDNEILIAHHGENTPLYRLERNSHYDQQVELSKNFPRRLSQTGLFENTPLLRPAPGVEPYQINWPQWMDTAKSQYLVAVPDLQSIQQFETNVAVEGLGQGLFQTRQKYPPGTVLAKTISIDRNFDPAIDDLRRLETQVLHFDGLQWQGYTYVWDDDQRDAHLAEAQGTEIELDLAGFPDSGEVSKYTWRVHSRTECMQCHNPWADNVLGFQPFQLHGASTRESPTSHWDRLVQLGLITTLDAGKNPISSDRCLTQIFPSQGSNEIGNISTARTYLHVNCSACHVFGGGGTVDMSLRATDELEAMKIREVAPAKGNFQIPDAKIMAPGRSSKSILMYRMTSPRSGHMPHLGSRLVDSRGVAMLADWIDGLTSEASAAEGSQATPVRRSVDTESIDGVDRALELAIEMHRMRIDDFGLAASGITFSGLHSTGPPSTGLASSGPIRATARAMYTHANPLIADLFESFLPASEHRRRLGMQIDLEKLLELPGDIERGRRLFFQSGVLQCAQCHRVHGDGKSVGPELSTIGSQRTRRQLLESLLEPSRIIEDAYKLHIIQTDDDQIQTGLMVSRDQDRVLLRNSRGETIELAVSEIVAEQVSDRSMMPDQMLRDLSPQQAADLISYLESLKSP